MSHTATCDEVFGAHDHPEHGHGHGHSHGLVDPSITRSRAGLRAVGVSLVVLGATAAIQTAIYARTGSVALLGEIGYEDQDIRYKTPNYQKLF